MGSPEDLQAEARTVLALLEPLGPVTPTGSFVSGLMVWRDLDVMLTGGPDHRPEDVVALLGRAVTIPGLTGFSVADQRGDRSPTGKQRDERFHVVLTVGAWRVDLSIWLHDDHADVTEWHRALAARLTEEERQAILAIKQVWHRRPEYPDEVGGFDIYTAVLEHEVRTAVEFGVWLRTAR
ncbi:hypothetical protein [Actinoplanes utahensis]|uniref:Polymerase nucleotidyl transferase domain-containing protein n=1 Tax=Actinoplanes utahensis TaxID=1869 RepID=A0A0A6X3Q2_ACTUT|nr:hypothetical protein [Actinoplanes utahensis]KHD73084.1 hypothetical protein MB27_36200 [Actinoplanes utahensis]KHD74727.1 hypothetical protein MB27_26800 [Actinoplanes utahensis]GIF34299.1 hypothetical protein Aut01nite_72850 [Actinoplanes utahensis]